VYLTPGRTTADGGAWLDKAYHVQQGARAAGAACVWQKVVLIQDSAGRTRGGRPGFVNMLCLSKCHRVPPDFTTVDAQRSHRAGPPTTFTALCSLTMAARSVLLLHVAGRRAR
jgi:hypothetical protein